MVFGEWMSTFPFSVDKVKWNIIPCAEILLSWDKLITYESKKQKPTACDQASHHHLEPWTIQWKIDFTVNCR